MLKSDKGLTGSISHFVTASRGLLLETGDMEGDCCICGATTAHGFPVDLPKTFMTWQYFLEGDNLCAPCWHMVKDAKYRRSSWLATEDSFEFLKRPGVRAVLEAIPEPPWALYITLAYRKHGWILTEVNTSRERFFLTVDEGRFHVTAEELADLTKKVRAASEYVGRYWWLKSEILTENLGRMALEEPGLYEWFNVHWSDPLVLALVNIMILTKKERKKIESDD